MKILNLRKYSGSSSLSRWSYCSPEWASFFASDRMNCCDCIGCDDLIDERERGSCGGLGVGM